MKKKLYILFLLAITFVGTEGQNYQQVIDTANAAYKNGDYTKAIKHYDSIVDQGYISAELFYNLGNAHFKKQQLAQAILFYEKALKHDPGNEDIQHNLSMARQMTIDKIEKVPEMFYVQWWKNIYNLFSADAWAKIVVGAFVVTLVLLAIFILARSIPLRKFSFYTGLVAILITVFSFVVAIKKHHDFTHDKSGIVFNPSVTVKGSPDEDSVDLFVIHEGTKVYIQDKLGDWYEIKIENGSVGWIKKKTVRII